MKIELAHNWNVICRLWSVWCAAIGTLVMGLFSVWPESALYLWNAMPAEIRGQIPERFVTVLAAFIFFMTAASRIVKQKELRIDEKRSAEKPA